MATKRILAQAPTVFTASGLVYTGPCIFQGFLIGTDGTNDATIVFYNNTSAAGTKIIPSCTYDATTASGIYGVTGMHQYCDKGLYVEITCAGSVEVIPQYIPYHYPENLNWPNDHQL